MENPLKYFVELRDPRVERNREHLLEEILLISIAAVLSGAESWSDIAEFGEDKLEWLKTFLTLPSGIPSHDTFNRVFAALDQEEMEKGFVAWASSIAKQTTGEVVAIDGKALCSTRETGKKTLVHMVSAGADQLGRGPSKAQIHANRRSKYSLREVSADAEGCLLLDLFVTGALNRAAREVDKVVVRSRRPHGAQAPVARTRIDPRQPRLRILRRGAVGIFGAQALTGFGRAFHRDAHHGFLSALAGEGRRGRYG